MHLTHQEIIKIELEAKSNPEFMEDTILHLSRTYTSVVKVSKTHQLILIEGNEKTGLQHINKRHDYFLSRTNWKGNKLGTGKTFFSRTLGHWDYLRIAERIYDPQNLVIEPNSNGDYDVYRAILDINNIKSFYRLVLYRGTKIVHTLYPEQDISKWKRPSNFNFIRIVSSVRIHYANCKKDITISYKNKKEIVYRITITKDYHLHKELVEISDAKNEKTFYSKEYNLPFAFDHSPIELMMYDDADLEILENEILNYHHSVSSRLLEP